MSIEECIKVIKDKAKSNDADADIFITESSSLCVRCRNQEFEVIEKSNKTTINFRVIKDHKLASMTYGKLKDTEEMVNKALNSARHLKEDLFLSITKNNRVISKIKNHQITQEDIETLKKFSIDAEKTGLAYDGITNSGSASFECHVTKVTLANTNGFFGECDQKIFSASVELIAGQGASMNPGYDYITCDKMQYIDPIAIGKAAAQRAVDGMNPNKVATCKVDIVFESRCAAGLLKNLARALNAENVVQSSTFLRDDLNNKIFPENISIINDPLIDGGIEFRPFDDESTETRRIELIENGVLKTWVLDTYNANKLKMQTNGMGKRSSDGEIHPSCFNLYLHSSNNINEEQIIADIKDGFYVTDTFGFGINSTTGDYSQGAKGIWIKDGKLTFPVSEVTIAGNLRTMYKSIIAANNLKFRGYINSPTLFVGKMMVSGK